jgi:mRNA interferase RelE/StbE
VSDQLAPYVVELAPAAERALRKLDKPIARRLAAAMAALGHDPRPAASTPLVGHPGALRLRIGDYRVVYRIEDERLVVLVLDLGHRREVYRSW